MSKKVKVTNGAFVGLINSLFQSRDYELTDRIEDADLLVFSGGEDVDPFFYDTATHPTTRSNYNKDQREMHLYHQAKELGLPCVGICRGAQLLHILNDGELWQDVDNHGRTHKAYTFGTNIPVVVSSMHHQMLRPNSKRENIILLYANEATKKRTMSVLDPLNEVKPYEISRLVNTMYKDDDIEALVYPDTNDLCFQPHPELYMGGREEQLKPMVDLFFNYINTYCFNDNKEAA